MSQDSDSDGPKAGPQQEPPAPSEPMKAQQVEPSGAGQGPPRPPRDKTAGDGSAEGKPRGNEPGISDKALVDRIKKSDPWMIFLTAALVICGLLQWCELHSSGTDTKHLADAASSQANTTQNLALIASDELSDAAEQANAMSSLADTTQQELSSLRDSVKAAQDAATAAKAQVAVMRADQRPWVSIAQEKGELSVNLVDPLIIKLTGGGTRVNIVLRNTGHTPAFGVLWQSKIIALHRRQSSQKEIGDFMASYCEPLRKQPPEILEPTLFPDETYTVTGYPIDVSGPDIQLALATGPGASMHQVILAFVGCVDYRDDAGAHHQSRYGFHIAEAGPAPGTLRSFDPAQPHSKLYFSKLLQSAD